MKFVDREELAPKRSRRMSDRGSAERYPFKLLPPEAKARLRKIAQPDWIAPMLATLTKERFSRPGWLFEPKWDGERCLAFRNGRHLRLVSRSRKQLNEKYPEVAAALRRQEINSFIADGEIVAFKNGVTSSRSCNDPCKSRIPRRIFCAAFGARLHELIDAARPGERRRAHTAHG
jgi:ATP-dependent DNA ligase